MCCSRYKLGAFVVFAKKDVKRDFTKKTLVFGELWCGSVNFDVEFFFLLEKQSEVSLFSRVCFLGVFFGLDTNLSVHKLLISHETC